MGVIVLVYYNKIISLPAPLLYYVFDRFVLLHKILSSIFAVFTHISPCFLSFICTPNGKTAEPEYYRHAAKAKERMGGKSLSGCRLELVRSLGRANFHIWKLASPNDSNDANFDSNKVFRFSIETNRRHECLSIFIRNQNQTFQGFSSVSV